MAKTALIIDCDPGVDDAMALFLAFASPQALELLAVTTVGGNVDVALTARNARYIRQLAGREDVPVFAGAARPLVRAPIAASHFHGESGLGWLTVTEPAAPSAGNDAAQAIVDLVLSRPAGAVTLAVTGPMTNLALAIRLEPRIVSHLGPVVAMGGARSEGGNITASAEYNIFADPHAAHEVLSCGAQVVMIGLDATHQVRATPRRTAAIAALDTVAARTVTELLAFCRHIQETLVKGEAPPLHDPCTIAYILRPDLFTAVPVDLRVETDSLLTRGHTAVEFRLPDPSAANALWVTQVDADGVFDLLTERLAR